MEAAATPCLGRRGGGEGGESSSVSAPLSLRLTLTVGEESVDRFHVFGVVGIDLTFDHRRLAGLSGIRAFDADTGAGKRRIDRKERRMRQKREEILFDLGFVCFDAGMKDKGASPHRGSGNFFMTIRPSVGSLSACTGNDGTKLN